MRVCKGKPVSFFNSNLAEQQFPEKLNNMIYLFFILLHIYVVNRKVISFSIP